MRLTAFVCHRKRVLRDKLPYLRRVYWRDQYSNLTVDKLRVPSSVFNEPPEKNPLRRAEDMLTSTRYEDELAREIELGVTPEEAAEIEAERRKRLAPWSAHAGDFRHHAQDKPTLMYFDRRRFSHGLQQASLLTNTAVMHELPDSVKPFDRAVRNMFEAESDLTSNLRREVERAILHAHVWHTDEDKLPRRFCAELPIWRHKTEFGIHPQQITRYLFQNLLRLLERQLPVWSNTLGMNDCPTRWTTRDRLLESHYFWGRTKRRIDFALEHDLVISGSEPLVPFVSDADEITQLSGAHKPPIDVLGPMSPLIDLQSTTYYRDDISDGWNPDQPRRYRHPHLITINLSLPNAWSDFLEPEADPITPEQRQASALMHCFASASAHLRSLGEPLVNSPVCVQGICSDGVYFDFLYFQLNTLDCPDPRSERQDYSGLRNFVWIDGNHRLFDKQVPKRSMLRNTKYRDLDLSVVSRLLTSFLWGLTRIPVDVEEPLLQAKAEQ